MVPFLIVLAALAIFVAGYKVGQKFPHPKIIESQPEGPAPAGVTQPTQEPK